MGITSSRGKGYMGENNLATSRSRLSGVVNGHESGMGGVRLLELLAGPSLHAGWQGHQVLGASLVPLQYTTMIVVVENLNN